MPGSITTKQHDTRPIRTLALVEQNPGAAVGVTRPVDLTNATTAKLLAKNTGNGDTFSSILVFTSRVTGVLTWTPVAGDTDTSGTYQAEVEITWNDGGIETYPNDGYFIISIIPDQG